MTPTAPSTTRRQTAPSRTRSGRGSSWGRTSRSVRKSGTDLEVRPHGPSQPGQVRPEGEQRPAAPGAAVVAPPRPTPLLHFERVRRVAEPVLGLDKSKLPAEDSRTQPALAPPDRDVAVLRVTVNVESRRRLAGID